MKYLQCLLICWLTIGFPAFGSKSEPENVFKFDGITTVKIHQLEANIQFISGSSSQVSIITDNMDVLQLTAQEGTLNIVRSSRSQKTIQLRIFIPETCRLDVEVIGKSHVFIPSIKAPVRVVADDLSQVTIDKCTGLVITQGGFAKTQIQQLAGDMSAALSGRSQLGIKSGTIATTLITATDETYISIAAAMQSLKLSTKGDAKIQLGSIINTLIWVGTGNEQISINNLSGTAEITANYNSRLNVEKANLDTLLAATSSTGKIKILGSVKNAALSARGASEIVIDKITGKILRKNQSSKGIITILNP